MFAYYHTKIRYVSQMVLVQFLRGGFNSLTCNVAVEGPRAE